MRVLLLLSALLSAFAGTSAPARAADVSAAQVSTLARVVAARAAKTMAIQRPTATVPVLRDVLARPVLGDAPVLISSLYAGRLRT